MRPQTRPPLPSLRSPSHLLNLQALRYLRWPLPPQSKPVDLQWLQQLRMME